MSTLPPRPASGWPPCAACWRRGGGRRSCARRRSRWAQRVRPRPRWVAQKRCRPAGWACLPAQAAFNAGTRNAMQQKKIHAGRGGFALGQGGLGGGRKKGAGLLDGPACRRMWGTWGRARARGAQACVMQLGGNTLRWACRGCSSKEGGAKRSVQCVHGSLRLTHGQVHLFLLPFICACTGGPGDAADEGHREHEQGSAFFFSSSGAGGG